MRKGFRRRLSEFLSPMSRLSRWRCSTTLEFTWETFPEYLDQMDQPSRRQCRQFDRAHRGPLLRDGRRLPEAHRHRGTRSRQCRALVRDGMQAGALGLSVSRNQGHFDPQGVHIPAIWANKNEIFALGDVLRDMGTGLIQSGGGNGAEMKDALMSRDVHALRVEVSLVARHREAERAGLHAVADEALHLPDLVLGGGALLAVVAHHVIADRGVPDQIADIDAEMVVHLVEDVRGRSPR